MAGHPIHKTAFHLSSRSGVGGFSFRTLVTARHPLCHFFYNKSVQMNESVAGL